MLVIDDLKSENTDNLKSTLSSIPDLTTKLQTWNRLIKEMDFKEREQLNLCINNLELDADLEVLRNNEANLKDQLEYYEKIFSALTKRMKIPLEAYQQRINFLSKSEFKQKAKDFRISEDLRLKAKAENEAKRYFKDFNESKMNVWDYIRTCEGFVTPFLFTPEILACADYEERLIRNKEFEGFSPEGYCKLFKEKLRELFKNANKI